MIEMRPVRCLQRQTQCVRRINTPKKSILIWVILTSLYITEFLNSDQKLHGVTETRRNSFSSVGYWVSPVKIDSKQICNGDFFWTKVNKDVINESVSILKRGIFFFPVWIQYCYCVRLYSDIWTRIIMLSVHATDLWGTAEADWSKYLEQKVF